LSASERLASTKSERFGVALGSEIEAINTVYTQPSYAEAIALGVAKIHNEGRANARSALVILGNGNSKDSEALMIATAARIRETPSVTSFAVDASLSTNVTALEMFTGSSNHVYPYEKTAAFAKEINRLASSSENGICRSLQREVRGRLHAAAGVEVRFFFFSTPGPLKAETSLQRDALVEPLNVDKINEGKALTEYTTDHGARPGHARPVAIIFTDGYAQKSTSEEAAMLRAVIPDTYAIAINHNVRCFAFDLHQK
ncbi:hypothetical protein GCK32_016357, partial [Trichostrongylus colubriformis]